MYLPSEDIKAPGNEPRQPSESRSVARLVIAAESQTHRRVLSSVQEEDANEEDEISADRQAHTSPAGESGEEGEPYEPPDVLDSWAEGEYRLASECRGKAVTVAARTAREGPPCNMGAAQDTRNPIRKACKEPVPDCHACRMSDENVTTRKRQRSQSQAYHLPQ
ncbi:hypothetical protein PMIN01_13395 [Paraphaeosphaeria minitans]|uniref:Uncharacterized protein n=1 Tax=Paraphaeosphaeria minitans TaxID=565426 RepID=A0A9P6G3T6_9PLEO|nr:hypothetical protein PMIN01_13395 [Paraphaeosphaeria minitans]